MRWVLMERRGLYLSGHLDYSTDVPCISDRPGMTEDHMTAGTPDGFLLIASNPSFLRHIFDFVFAVSEKYKYRPKVC